MADKTYEGRVTIDDEGRIIGSGGAAIGERMRVEQDGKVVGYTTRPQFEAAYRDQRPMTFKRLREH